VTFSSHIGARLKEARKAIGLSQAEIAEATGVTREYWGRLERGMSAPGGEVLAALAARGADVNYILIGGPSKTASLSSDEETLVALFRDAPLAVKAAAIGALQGARVAAVQPRVKVTAHGGNAAGRDVKINNPGQERTHDGKAKGGKPARQRSGA
jgi:transcriptional regulator with XRE-family HTH domain